MQNYYNFMSSCSQIFLFHPVNFYIRIAPSNAMGDPFRIHKRSDYIASCMTWTNLCYRRFTARCTAHTLRWLMLGLWHPLFSRWFPKFKFSCWPRTAPACGWRLFNYGVLLDWKQWNCRLRTLFMVFVEGGISDPRAHAYHLIWGCIRVYNTNFGPKRLEW